MRSIRFSYSDGTQPWVLDFAIRPLTKSAFHDEDLESISAQLPFCTPDRCTRAERVPPWYHARRGHLTHPSQDEGERDRSG